MYGSGFNKDFEYAGELGKILVPVLNKALKYGNIIQTEHLKDEIAQLLDKMSGIDGLLITQKGVGGIALRIQQNANKNWQTFTIRYKRSTGTETEYAKRKKQIYEGSPTFYPHYTCQAYINDKGILIGGGFCLTKDLFDVVIKAEPFVNKSHIYLQANKSDGNQFLVVPFRLIKRILLF